MSAYNPPLENLDQFVTSNFELKELTDGNTLTEANKLYVDSEIYTAGLNYLNLSTNQTIASGAIKNFASSPLVPTPTTNFQASTKKYVDDTVAGIDYSNYLTLDSNQTIASGAIKTFISSPIVPTPTTDYQASTKKYTDDTFAGINLSNYLTLNSSQTIANGAVKTFTTSPIVPTPTTDYHASTKKYVDDQIFDVDVTTFVAGTSNLQNAFFGYGTGNSASYTKSTAIGYNALITASNQVVLGTSNTNISIPYRLGVGTTSPDFPVEVNGSVDSDFSYSRYVSEATIDNTPWAGGGNIYTNSSTPRVIGLHASNAIGCNYVIFHSDRRMKKNIVDVPDNLALQQVRDIPCRYYQYIDNVTKGSRKVVGFIAQEVNEVLPTSITKIKKYIPDEYRPLENISWEEIESGNSIAYKLSSDLTDVSGVKYRFIVANDENNDTIIEKDIVGNSDNTFTFDDSYQNVFCYGKEVDDFHMIDKNQIFALHHSAIQEIDKQQTADKLEISQLKQQLADVLLRLDAAGI